MGSRSEQVEKRMSENQKKLFQVERISICFDSLFLMIFLKFVWTAFVFFVARVCQLKTPWDHFSSHFVEKLGRLNLCFRSGQTAFFMVFRDWVWRY